jgi:hypothetical protein
MLVGGREFGKGRPPGRGMTQRSAARPPSRLSTGGSQHGLFGGLCVSELAGLTWSDIVARNKGQVQPSVLGKGGIVRQVLLSEAVSRRCYRSAATPAPTMPCFASRKTDTSLTERAVLGIVKRAAARAGIDAPVRKATKHSANATHSEGFGRRADRDSPGPVLFDALTNVAACPVRRHLGDFETVSRERAVRVALGLVLLDMSRLSSRLELRTQGDMAALVGKDVELPPGCPCWREDCAGRQ